MLKEIIKFELDYDLPDRSIVIKDDNFVKTIPYIIKNNIPDEINSIIDILEKIYKNNNPGLNLAIFIKNFTNERDLYWVHCNQIYLQYKNEIEKYLLLM